MAQSLRVTEGVLSRPLNDSILGWGGPAVDICFILGVSERVLATIWLPLKFGSTILTSDACQLILWLGALPTGLRSLNGYLTVELVRIVDTVVRIILCGGHRNFTLIWGCCRSVVSSACVVMLLVLVFGSFSVFGLEVLGVRLRLVMAISLVVNRVIVLGSSVLLHLVTFAAVACLRLGDLATALPLSCFNVQRPIEILDQRDGRHRRQLDLQLKVVLPALWLEISQRLLLTLGQFGHDASLSAHSIELRVSNTVKRLLLGFTEEQLWKQIFKYEFNGVVACLLAILKLLFVDLKLGSKFDSFLLRLLTESS